MATGSAMIDATARVSPGAVIGEGVRIGPNASVLGPADAVLREAAGAVVHAGAVVGANAVVCPGVVVGARAVIGAGAVVTRDVPPLAIVVGNPARIVGYVDAIAGGPAAGAALPGGSPLGASPSGVRGVTVHRLKVVRDLRGDLSVADFGADVPFVPRRFFLVFDVPSERTRGQHAHRRCKQFLVCVKGSCAVVADDGTNRREIALADPGLGLYLPPMTWGIQYKYSRDAVLLVFASESYDSADYIRDYDEFLALASARDAGP